MIPTTREECLTSPFIFPNSFIVRFGVGACFSKVPKTFQARQAIFSSSVFKTGDVYRPETSCLKGTSVHIESMWIKQLCNHKLRDFAMAFVCENFSEPSRNGLQVSWIKDLWKSTPSFGKISSSTNIQRENIKFYRVEHNKQETYLRYDTHTAK